MEAAHISKSLSLRSVLCKASINTGAHLVLVQEMTQNPVVLSPQ